MTFMDGAQYHTGRVVNGPNGGRNQRLVLMGDRRSGKSSIAGVVFQKTPPSETLFTEATTEITPSGMQSFMNFHVVELPGHFDYLKLESDDVFRDKGAVIWVMDAQDQYLDALNHLLDTITYLAQHWPAINVEVFVHKVDGLSEEFRNDTFRDIRQRVQDELSDLGYDNVQVSFYQTSIYDHSVFEAVSNVVQKLMPQLPTLESLLNSLCSSCRIQKAYLFDIPSKIFIASDTSPQESKTYEVCSDLIDVVVDIGELYGWDRSTEPSYVAQDKTDIGNDACESLVMMERRGQSYLYLKEMNQFLALVCIMADDSPVENQSLVDYNVGVFRDALAKVWQW
ncbi:ras-related GTP-binding protein-like protein C [Myriangium duriaei CBS 260.36]|uniref:GTP-binding protein n=1 Tax=Myriangium duriaei CBS 260.36 TaxID=1168546 RepID=A0A9P4MLQ3_9PEZI|nr:ras-related GTP-binding protein-like protein C [Myriangium duriaei CBS 260.36]